MKSLALALSLITALTLTACGPDKDVEQYKNSRIQRDLAKMETVGGRYSGVLTSKKSGNPLGGFQITLGATTQVQEPGNNQTSAQPILVANVEFLAESRMAIIAKNSYYDTANGHYQADIEIPPATVGGTPTRVSLSAVLKDGKMNGTVEAIGFSDWGGTFELTQNGESLEDIVAKTTPVNELAISTSNFNGETNFAAEGDLKSASTRRPVELILVRPKTTSEQDFLNLISPVKAVLVTLNYGSGARIPFTNGNWDQRNGSLTAQRAIQSSANEPLNLLISCASANAGKDFNCDLTTTASSEPVATLSVSSANKTTVSKDSDQGRIAMQRKYVGTAKADSGKTYKVLMTTVYAARTRLDEIQELLLPVAEKTLQISLAVNPQILTIPFSTGRWDTQNKTISAVQKSMVAGQTFDITLECRNFAFVSDKGHYDFTCVYGTTFQGTSLNVRFKK